MKAYPPEKWKRPVCLMVDEIQSIWQPDTQRIMPGVSSTLRSLHEDGEGLPIVPVLAGLGSSHEVLKKANLTRIAPKNIFNIGCLREDEARESVMMMLDRFSDATRENMRDWPQRLFDTSEGWPQHLHNGMISLAEDLDKVEGRLSEVTEHNVMAAEGKLRTDAYGRRITDDMSRARNVVARVMQSLPENGLRGSTIKNRIRELARSEDHPENDGWLIPEADSKRKASELFLSHLVHSGALQPTIDKLHYCPIPSFRSYLMVKGGLEAEKKQDNTKLLEGPRSDESFDVLKATDKGRARRLQRSTNVSAEPIIPEPE